jgi:ABC-2 type transport system ATP-binding protein
MKPFKTQYTLEDSQKEECMENAIEIKGLVKKFRTKQKEAGLIGSFRSLFKSKIKEVNAVDNISFNIKKGEIIGFIGPNGAGKSTTIKILSGILFPDSGDIKVLGLDPQEQRKKLAFKIGCVFGQKPQLWYHLPAIDTFDLFSKIYELDEKEYKSRLNYLVDLFEIRDLLRTPVRKLSLGQRMKCEIVASMLHKPEVLFLDEPTIGLDIVAKQKIRELILELNKKEKVTILLTSHDTQDIEHLCKRIIIINHGKIVYDNSLDFLEKTYLKNKIVGIKFSGPFKGINLKGVKTIKSEKYSADFEISTEITSIQKFLDSLMNRYDIADIDISSTPIEEVITKIYGEK